MCNSHKGSTTMDLATVHLLMEQYGGWILEDDLDDLYGTTLGAGEPVADFVFSKYNINVMKSAK